MIALFPHTAISRLVYGFLAYSGLATHEASKDKRPPIQIDDDEDPFDLVVVRRINDIEAIYNQCCILGLFRKPPRLDFRPSHPWTAVH